MSFNPLVFLFTHRDMLSKNKADLLNSCDVYRKAECAGVDGFIQQPGTKIIETRYIFIWKLLKTADLVKDTPN